MTQAEVLRIKAAVRARDGMRCTKCGTENVEHIRKHRKQLHVHRTVPGSEYSEATGVCVTLCFKCHGPEPKSPPALIASLPSALQMKLRTIRALRREMGEDFDPVAFVNRLLEKPVGELYMATCDAFCEFHTRRKAEAE